MNEFADKDSEGEAPYGPCNEQPPRHDAVSVDFIPHKDGGAFFPLAWRAVVSAT